jgi:hypothetical protein
MKLVISFGFSAFLVSGLILLVWVVGVIGQSPAIPVQTPEVSYVDIILHKKKHNPINDFYPIPPLSY